MYPDVGLSQCQVVDCVCFVLALDGLTSLPASLSLSLSLTPCLSLCLCLCLWVLFSCDLDFVFGLRLTSASSLNSHLWSSVYELSPAFDFLCLLSLIIFCVQTFAWVHDFWLCLLPWTVCCLRLPVFELCPCVWLLLCLPLQIYCISTRLLSLGLSQIIEKD